MPLILASPWRLERQADRGRVCREGTHVAVRVKRNAQGRIAEFNFDEIRGITHLSFVSSSEKIASPCGRVLPVIPCSRVAMSGMQPDLTRTAYVNVKRRLLLPIKNRRQSCAHSRGLRYSLDDRSGSPPGSGCLPLLQVELPLNTSGFSTAAMAISAPGSRADRDLRAAWERIAGSGMGNSPRPLSTLLFLVLAIFNH